MASRMELTYSEIADILHTKNLAASSTELTFPPGKCEVYDLNLMLKSLLPSFQ